MADVLAVEPNAEQRSILQEILRDEANATVLAVDSKEAAISALEDSIPDLVLVSALLSPRDESDLLDCIKGLPNALHLQTLTIPQLRIGSDDEQGQGRFSLFRKRRPTPGTVGCDPRKFAEEVAEYLDHAAVIRRVHPTTARSISADTSDTESPEPATPESRPAESESALAADAPSPRRVVVSDARAVEGPPDLRTESPRRSVALRRVSGDDRALAGARYGSGHRRARQRRRLKHTFFRHPPGQRGAR